MKNLTILLALVVLATFGGFCVAWSLVGLVALLHFVQWENKTYANAATGSRSIKRTYNYDFAN